MYLQLQEDLDYESLEDNDSITHSELGEFAPSSMLQQQSTFGMFEQEHLLVEVPKKVHVCDFCFNHVFFKGLMVHMYMWNIVNTHNSRNIFVHQWRVATDTT